MHLSKKPSINGSLRGYRVWNSKGFRIEAYLASSRRCFDEVRFRIRIRVMGRVRVRVRVMVRVMVRVRISQKIPRARSHQQTH